MEGEQGFSYPLDPSVHLVCCVYEVGRGPLGGDVVTAAVILDSRSPVEGLRDSKQLTEHRREVLYRGIL